MTLYEIDTAITQVIYDYTDPETGELTDDGIAMLDALTMDKRAKQEGIALYCKELDSEVSQIDGEIERLKARKEEKAHKRDRLSNYLQYSLAGEKLETAQFSIKYRHSKSVSLCDGWVDIAREIRPDLIREKVEYAPDKAQIKKLLEAGELIDGATLVEKTLMSIN